MRISLPACIMAFNDRNFMLTHVVGNGNIVVMENSNIVYMITWPHNHTTASGAAGKLQADEK